MSDASLKTRKITPTGVLASTAPPQSDEWFAVRREGITGTDLPKILGDSKYGNALSVWLDKRDEAPAEDGDLSEAGEWGTILEDPVARVWAARNDLTVSRVGIIHHVDHLHRRASLDRIVHGCPQGGRCGLEVKTRSAFKAEAFNEDVPDDVLAQIAWGRHVTGLDHMHVAVLIGGQKLLQFTYERDDQLEGFLIEQADAVWQAVVDGTPPAATPDGDGVLLDLLNRLYEAREGDRELDPIKALTWFDRYQDGLKLEAESKAIKTEAKTALVQMLGDGDTGRVDKAPLFTYKPPKPTHQVTADAMKRLRADHPETFEALLADGIITVKQDGPRFTLKKK